VYGEVLQKIQQDYVDDPNMRTVTAGSLHGMLESLDAQSSYLTPRRIRRVQEETRECSTAETGLTLQQALLVTSLFSPCCGQSGHEGGNSQRRHFRVRQRIHHS